MMLMKLMKLKKLIFPIITHKARIMGALTAMIANVNFLPTDENILQINKMVFPAYEEILLADESSPLVNAELISFMRTFYSLMRNRHQLTRRFYWLMRARH
jgi:hypothetical protein